MTAPAPAAPLAALSLSHLSKTYGRTTVLRDVSLIVAPGQVHALVGGNGSGKSTLIKSLAGVIDADPGGTIAVHGRATPTPRWNAGKARSAGLRFVHQDLGLFGELSVAENLHLGQVYPTRRPGVIDWRRTRQDADALLQRFGVAVAPRARVADLAPAERSMIAIVRCLRGVGDDGERVVIVLDEPTAALHLSEVDRLLAFIGEITHDGHSVLMVSHHIEEVRGASSQITVLRDGRVVGSGATASYSRGKLIELIVGKAGVEQDPHPTAGSSDQTVLQANDLRTARLAPTTLQVAAGECLGLTGLVGSGASEVPAALYGLVPSTSTALSLDGHPLAVRTPRQAIRAGLAFVPADRRAHGVFVGMSISHNLSAASLRRFARIGVLRRRHERESATRLTGQFHIVPARTDRIVDVLSGGNQQKVVLGRWVDTKPRLLLLEEPTQGVDIGARHEIWRLIREFAAQQHSGVLAVSSDLEELAAHCDRVLVFGHGALAGELSGDSLTAAALMNAVYEAEQTDTPTSDTSPDDFTPADTAADATTGGVSSTADVPAATESSTTGATIVPIRAVS